MSRWKSPQTASRRAERAAKEAEQLHKEKRNARLLIVGVVVLSISLSIADYFWLKSRAQKRLEQHRHHRAQTNSTATPIPTSKPADSPH